MAKQKTQRLIFNVSYLGHAAHGWQRQKIHVSIQSLLEETIEKISGVPQMTVHAAARTDQGVHAKAQIAIADVPAIMEPWQWAKAINNQLPREVVITWAAFAPKNFRPRHDCGTKTYHYTFRFSPVRDPFQDLFSWWIPDQVDLSTITDLCASWLGQRDWIAASSSKRDEGKTTIRTLTESRFEILPNEQARFIVAGTGFLMHQVRILAGTIAWRAKNIRSTTQITQAIEQKNRQGLGPTAPACGLTLVSIVLPRANWQAPWPTALPPYTLEAAATHKSTKDV